MGEGDDVNNRQHARVACYEITLPCLITPLTLKEGCTKFIFNSGLLVVQMEILFTQTKIVNSQWTSCMVILCKSIMNTQENWLVYDRNEQIKFELSSFNIY